MTIGILPDEVLLLIFHFSRMICLNGKRFSDQPLHPSWRWCRLVHVCRRWRSVGFAWPKFLDFRLLCHSTSNTRVGHLGIWPPLLIVREPRLNSEPSSMQEDFDFDAAIMHHNRICAIDLFGLTHSQLRQLALGMQRQLPALTYLALSFKYKLYNGVFPAPPLPGGFLGGSAPSLQFFMLGYIPFPALPKLLLSATDLVRLELVNA